MKLFDYLFSHRIRKCAYCGRIKFCEYIKYIYETEWTEQSWRRGIEGYFCSDCQKHSIKDIFKNLKSEKYFFHIINK